jgi:hypothetical protein
MKAKSLNVSGVLALSAWKEIPIMKCVILGAHVNTANPFTISNITLSETRAKACALYSE